MVKAGSPLIQLLYFSLGKCLLVIKHTKYKNEKTKINEQWLQVTSHDSARCWLSNRWIILTQNLKILLFFSCSGEGCSKIVWNRGQDLCIVVKWCWTFAPAAVYGLCHVIFLVKTILDIYFIHTYLVTTAPKVCI